MSGEPSLPISQTVGQFLQAGSFHFGVVRDLKDPQGRGRVQVESPSLWGKDNWVWCESAYMPVGSSYRDGDHGMWWTPTPGERVLVSFIAGDHGAPPIMLPGPAWQIEPGNDKQLIPLEPKKIHKDRGPRAGTKIRTLKTESGATWFVDDNGKSECMFFCDWTGAGAFWDAPGKEADVPEKKGNPSTFRNAERRGTKNIANGKSKKVSELVEGGVSVLSYLDLNGQGVVCIGEDGKGRVTIFAAKERGSIGPSIILDCENDAILLTTASGTQLQILGNQGHIAVTRQIILEAVLIPVAGFFSAIFARLKQTFMPYHVDDAQDLGQGNPRETMTV